jgi:hypothetical protein
VLTCAKTQPKRPKQIEQIRRDRNLVTPCRPREKRETSVKTGSSRIRLHQPHKPRVPRSIRGTATIFSSGYAIPPSRPHSIVLILCHFLAAIDPAPPCPHVNSRADGAHSAAPSRSFPPAQLLDPIAIDSRLNEPGSRSDSMLAILWGTTLAGGSPPPMATPSHPSNSPRLKRPIHGNRDSVRWSWTVSDDRIETINNSS